MKWKWISSFKTQLRALRAFRPEHIHLLGVGLALIGLVIASLPIGTNGTATYILYNLHIPLWMLGGAIALGGLLAIVFRKRLPVYLICISPWGLFTFGSLFFAISSHISATIPLTNFLIYILLIYEAFVVHE